MDNLKKVFPLLLLLISPIFLTAQTKAVFEGSKFINGKEIFCKVIGEGEPILVVHGGPGLAHNYLYKPFQELTDTYRLIFYDQRGCGQSSFFKKDESVTMETLVNDLESVRKEFNLANFYLAGQSWGALIAINYALKFPEHVNKLLLLEPAPGSSEYLPQVQQTILSRLSQDQKEKLAKISQMPELRTNPEIFNKFMNLRTQAYFFDSSFTKKRDFGYFDSSMVKKFFLSSAMFSTYMLNYNLYPQLKEIKCPTLIVHGDYDVVPTEAVEKMNKEIKNCQLKVVVDCGHFVHIEKPETYFSLIKNFLHK